MKTGLIFDMDGTLWDSSANVASAWNEKIKELGYDHREITKQDIMSIMGLTMDKIADIILDDVPKEERYDLLDKCGKSENDYLRRHGAVLYPDLEKTLIRLKEKYPLYIVSNCQSGYIESFLEYYGFGKYFEDIECYGNNLKPKADNIALIAERNGLDKSWYIGDIQGDHDAAVKAGSGFIHAAYGFGTIEQDVPKIEKFSDLPGLLEKL